MGERFTFNAAGYDRSDYAYVTGKVKVLETRLLSRGQLSRLLEARDFNDLLPALQQTGYWGQLDPLTLLPHPEDQLLGMQHLATKQTMPAECERLYSGHVLWFRYIHFPPTKRDRTLRYGLYCWPRL